MSSLKNRPATDNEICVDVDELKKNRALTKDFTELYLDLEKQGFFKPSYLHIFLRTTEVFLTFFTGLILVQQEYFVAKCIGTVLLGMTAGRCAWVVHESCHNGLSGNPKFDRTYAAIVLGLVAGFSSSWWSLGHNRHHAMPQRLKRDIDLNTMPLLVYNTKVLEDPKAGKGFMVQNQAYLFVLDTLLGILLWKLYVSPRFVWRHKLYLQMFFMSMHWVVLYQMGFWSSLVVTWIGAFYLFLNFAMSHSFLPVTSEPTHWVEYALSHTADVNKSLGAIGGWAFLIIK